MIPGPVLVTLVLLVLSLGVPGVELALRTRARNLGFLLSSTALAGLVGIGLAMQGHRQWSYIAFAVGAMILFPLAVLAYPRPAWRQPVVAAAAIGVVVIGAVSLFFTGRPEVFGWLVTGNLAILVVVVWWRLETSPGDRRALLWLVISVTVAMLVLGVDAFSSTSEAQGVIGVVAGVIGVAAWLIVGPSLWIGIRSVGRLDSRGLVVAAVVWFLTVLVYLAAFSGIASWLGVFDAPVGAARPGAPNPSVSLGLLGLIGAALATGFEPVRRSLRGVVDRLLFGDRPDPIGAATYVAGQAELGPLAVVEAVRESMALPYVGLFEGTTPLAESGTLTDNTRTLPVAGEFVLVVGVRSGDVRFDAQDRHALGVVIPLIAQVLRTEALADDLQKSRRETFALLEDERRRLRRDLHDGLGPRLSGIAYLADAARNSLTRDVAASDELIGQIRGEATDAVAEIRRIVYGMRPPALDQLGLVPALSQAGKELRNREGEQVQVAVTAEGTLPELSAVVEVAAYRIAVEAMANAARHSDATRVTTTLRDSGGALRVEVEDDGGTSGPWQPGVGLSSMAERAGLVGGEVEMGPTRSGGRVVAVLPLDGAGAGQG